MNTAKKIASKELGLSKKDCIVITGGDTTGHSGNTNLSFIIGNEDKMHGDGAVKLDCPMSFIYDIVSQCSVRAKPHATAKLSVLFALDERERGENDTHKKQNIIEAVVSAHKKITLLQVQAKHADADGKRVILEKAQKVFEDCLSIASRNIVNDHILCMLLKELDNPKESKYEIRSCRHLLFACILSKKATQPQGSSCLFGRNDRITS